MKNALKWLMVVIGILGLIGVRMVEARLFYDPFLYYFQRMGEIPMPEVQWPKLIGSHLLRFGLNLLFSLVVVHFMFKNKTWTAQAAVLITLVFLITFPLYLFAVYTDFKIGFLFSFYIRRFVIQPLILLLIVPLFYYRKQRL